MPKYNKVKDVTQDIIEVASHYNTFPKDVKITKAEIVEDEIGVNYLDVDFEINNITYNVNVRVYNNLSGAVSEVLGHIKWVYDALIKE